MKESVTVKKLRIFAMLMRLQEIRIEITKSRLLLVLEDYKQREERIFKLEAPKRFEAIEYQEYFETPKIHPKHQKSNKYRFHK